MHELLATDNINSENLETLLKARENGEADFRGIAGDTSYTITATHEDDTNSIDFFIVADQANTVDILVGEELESQFGYDNQQDLIRGVWLSGVSGMTCTTDTDCPSDSCNTMGTCSTFNYSVCDVNLRPRNQRCIMWATSKGFLSGVTDWMLGNFLWMLVIIVLLIGAGFMAYLFGRKN